jgi:hypothetical protein
MSVSLILVTIYVTYELFLMLYSMKVVDQVMYSNLLDELEAV